MINKLLINYCFFGNFGICCIGGPVDCIGGPVDACRRTTGEPPEKCPMVLSMGQYLQENMDSKLSIKRTETFELYLHFQ